MIYPPLDMYRIPFAEPIGHLTMQAAYAESQLITLCATVPYDGSPLQLSPGDTARQLRNWSDTTRSFVEQRLNLIEDGHWRSLAKQALHRYSALREQRHRAVHDAVEVGIFGGHDGQPVTVLPIGVQYKHDKGSSAVHINAVSPEWIAELACELYDLQQDLSQITAAVRDLNKTGE